MENDTDRTEAEAADGGFAGRLAAAMERRAATDAHVAAALYDSGIAVTPDTVRRWRLGQTEPRAGDIAVIAAFLDCTPNDLVAVQ